MWTPSIPSTPLGTVADTVLAISLVIALGILLRNNPQQATTHDLPPGPPGNLIIGHVLKVPASHQWTTFSDWARKYGDLMYIHVFGRPMIICNTFEACNDLMERRSSNYSDRPPIKSAEIIGMGAMLVLLRYGERWKVQRRAMQAAFDQQATYMYRASTHEELDRFLQDISDFQGDLRAKIHRFVAAAVIMAAYGHKVMSDDDLLVKQMENATHVTTSVGTPGSTVVDFFPFLQYLPLWLPGMQLMRKLREGRTYIKQALEIPLLVVRKEHAAGISRPSFISKLLGDYDENINKEELSEEDIAALGGMVFLAGGETTESSLSTFFLYMVLYPEVAKSAQAELDEFYSSFKRLPMFSDKHRLPYISCLVKEVYRLVPAVPLGIPHRSMQTDTYANWTIPAGSMIMSNLWHILRDERYYPDPEKFMPERHMDAETGLCPYEPAADPAKSVFGFGRRICPGRFLADDIIWITVANVLSLFDILPTVDRDTGKEIYPELEFVSGTTCTAKPYMCRIAPRSDAHRAMVRDLRG